MERRLFGQCCSIRFFYSKKNSLAKDSKKMSWKFVSCVWQKNNEWISKKNIFNNISRYKLLKKKSVRLFDFFLWLFDFLMNFLSLFVRDFWLFLWLFSRLYENFFWVICCSEYFVGQKWRIFLRAQPRPQRKYCREIFLSDRFY